MNELALFVGAGGGILGGKLLGWRTVCAVEINSFCARRLMQRQNEGHLSPFPIWDDVCTFDGRPWKGVVDVVSGGFPCQDISTAGKGAGITGKRSGLWTEMVRIIGEVRPQYVFVENSPMLTIRGLGTVLGDLAQMGFDAKWGVLSAENAGALHKRERIWIMADHLQNRNRLNRVKKTSGDSRNRQTREKMGSIFNDCHKIRINLQKWEVESSIRGIVDGVAYGVDRIKAIGNGQVPAVVKLAWNILNDNQEIDKDTD